MNSRKQRKILIVEDEIFIAEMIKVMLEDMGHEVVATAFDIASAEEAFDEGAFDFAIFDINLEGGLEGVELGRRAQKKGIPFMFLTSYTDRKTLEEAKLTKPGAYVIKPFHEEDLFAGMEMSLMHAGGKESDAIPVKLGHRTLLLKPNDVYILKADNIYVEVTTKEKRHLVRMSLTGFMETYPRDEIIRIHRSYAVNKNHVETWGKNSVQVRGEQIPISRSYRKEVMNHLE